MGAYALSPAAVAEAKVEGPAPAGVSSSFAPASVRGEPPRLSLVVLPFANIGGDPAQDYFVEGVTDSLTTDLSRIRGAFVIARSTAFTFKGKPIDVRAIGRELSVRYALEGSVKRRGDRLRVNVQLLDTQSGGHIWAERFDKPLSDFFDMQDEIVTRLVNQIGVELVRVEATRSERNQSPDALDLVFQGMAWSFKGLTFENVARAAFFERAITLDRDNVAALAWTSIADLAAALSFHSDDAVARLASAETAAAKTLSLAPDNPLARLSLAFVFALTKRAEQAIAQCGRALELNPNFAYAHALIGFCKALVGRAEETEAHVQEVLRLLPAMWKRTLGSPMSAPQRSFLAGMRKRSPGYGAPSRRTRTTPWPNSISPPPWRMWGEWSRRAPRRRPGSRFIRNTRSRGTRPSR